MASSIPHAEGFPPLVEEEAEAEREAKPKKGSRFPSAVSILGIVTLLVWVAALFIPAGAYQHDEDGAPIPGTYQRLGSALTIGERVTQLLLSPINGVYGLRGAESGIVDTETSGTVYGQIGVIVFIMAIGAFISVSFATKSFEVGVSSLADRLRSKGWVLIAAVMVLFSLLGTTMGFSVETFGFYALFLPLMAAMGYDRLTTAAMIILGALSGVMGATVNPFSIGVAAGEANVPIGDGILPRLVMWVVVTGMSVAWVLRYASKVRKDPAASLVGWKDPADGTAADKATDEVVHDPTLRHRLTKNQKWVLAITAFTFALMVFSVIPWSSILGATTGSADYMGTHKTETAPYWFELDWWFPQLSVLFLVASVVVGLVARIKEKELVKLITAGAADMVGPSLVLALAGGVSVIMNNTHTLDTILYSMENLVGGLSASAFGIASVLVNIPLAFLVPSSSGHAALAMPLLAPLADFAGVSRASTITAWILAHGLTLLIAPTSVVLVVGLSMARVGYDKWLRFAWPLLVGLFVVTSAAVAFIALR